MQKKKLWLLFCIALFILSSCSASSDDKELTVSAAASLTDAIKELVEAYEEDHELSIQLNLAGSGKLAQQIEQGAPVDVYLSANQDWMNNLENKQLIDKDTRSNFTSNTIVMIGNKDAEEAASIQEIALLPDNPQLAIGDPASVPAGTYTKESLQTIHLWDKLQNQMVFASDVRQVLAYVESGNADYGFVYSSDAKISDQVSVLARFDTSWHTPIVYPGAVTADSRHPQQAASFISFLHTEKAQSILRQYGFQKEMEIQ